MGGYVRTWRSLVDWEWYKDSNTKCLFLHLILTANHAEGRWAGITINPGQLITSSSALAESLGLSRQNVRTSLNKLKSTSEITIESTNKYILVTLTEWARYQSDEPLLTSTTTNGLTINQPATNQQLTTNKKNKNNKKEENVFTVPTIDEISEYCKQRSNGIDAEYFFNYYETRGWIMSNGKKMSKWQSAVITWEKRNKSNGSSVKQQSLLDRYPVVNRER
jgi:biotin operon repressor